MIKQRYRVEYVQKITRTISTRAHPLPHVVSGVEVKASLVAGPEFDTLAGIYAKFVVGFEWDAVFQT